MALTGVAYSVVGVDVTITAISDVDVSATNGMFGFEYGVDSGTYDSEVAEPGAVTNQQITIGALQEITLGCAVVGRAYYNLDELDPIATRVYGTPTLSFTVSSPVPSPHVPRGSIRTWSYR